VGEITSKTLNKMLEDRKFRSLVKTTNKYLKSDPKAYPLLVYQAIALANLGETRKAALTFGKVLNLDPNFVPALVNFGALKSSLGEFEEATRLFDRALLLNPKDENALFNLGSLRANLGKWPQAAHIFGQVLSLNPNKVDAIIGLGNCLIELAEADKAQNVFVKGLRVNPSSADLLNGLGMALRMQSRYEEAILCFERALQNSPRHTDILVNLGTTYGDLGDFVNARVAFEKAIRISPRNGSAHLNLAYLHTFISKGSQFKRMSDLVANKTLDRRQRMLLCFALAKALHDLQDYESAFRYYTEANRLQSELGSYEISHDRELFKSLSDTRAKILSVALIKTDLERPAINPIFIVGMPRSGTSLVEQIVSSHPNVIAGGELDLMSRFGKSICDGSTEITTECIRSFRERYLSKLAERYNGVDFVTDKMPSNFRFIALIKAAIPEAKIIHTFRKPSAVCWSNYSRYFESPGMRFSCSLEDLCEYYKLYTEFMSSMPRSTFNEMYPLDYETLVLNFELEVRNVISYLGLTWDDLCLRPDLNTGPVESASNIQVRKPVYQGSSEACLNYRQWLPETLFGLRNTFDVKS